MWEVLVRTPRGSNNPRKFSMLLAMFFMALFGYIFATAPTTYAANATWDGSNVVYNGNTYEPQPSGQPRPQGIKDTEPAYRYTDTAPNPDLAYFIYFSSGVANPQTEKEATYIRFTLNPPNRYADPTPKQTIIVTPVPAAATPTPDTEDGAFTDTCTIDGIGWIACPVMNGIAEGMDFVYERIRSFLVVQPITTSVDNPIYRIWVYSRDLANIAFIIGFLVIIYSYLVGGGFTGYEIRKILPRLAIAAILINLSYILSAIAVDLSNIAGFSINQLFENVRDEVLPGSSASDEAGVNWTSVTTAVLAGGVGTVAGVSLLPAAIGGAAGGLWFLLAPFLVGAALLIMVTFFVLAARQAIIIVLIAVAPLACAAFILPNTEKWFEKWRSLFFTMLIMFPAFGAVFGASQLAGELIIRTATSIEQIILGLGVMVAPLAVTPLLLKLGGGVLNRFGGIVNNSQKGAFDRFKNFNNERRSDFLAKQQLRNATQRDENGNLVNNGFMRRAAYRQDYKKYNRQRLRDANTGMAQQLYDADDNGIETARSKARRGYAKARGVNPADPTYAYGSQEIADLQHRTELQKNFTHGRRDDHWQHELQDTPALRTMLTDTRNFEGRAAVRSEAMKAEDDRTFQTALNTDATYANLRDMKKQTIVNAGVADIQKAAVDAAGQQEFRETVEGSRALSRVVKQTVHAKKQAEMYENIVQKAAEKSWSDRVRNDADTQATYLKSTRYTDGASLGEKQLEEFTIETRARGGEARGLAVQNQPIADTIRATGIELASRDSAIGELKDEQTSLVLKSLRDDKAVRSVAGAGTQIGMTKVYAKAQSGMTKMYLENVKAQTSIYSNDGYRVDEMLHAMQDDQYKLHDGTPVNTVAQHAAVQYVMEDIGNNWSVQKIIDWADTKGMEMIEGVDGKPDTYYDAAAYRAAIANNAPLPTALNSEEVGDRRDLLQMVVGGYRGGKNKVSYFTATMQERMNRGLSSTRYNESLGRDLTFSENAIMSEARMMKYEGNRVTGMDPDELARMAQVLREPELRKQMTVEQRQSIVEKIVQAQTSTQTRHLIKDRERGLMNVVASYLELPPNSDPDITTLQEIEKYYYQVDRRDENGEKYSVRVPKGTEDAYAVEIPVQAPNVYDYTRQNDYVSGSGLEDPQP